MSLTPEERARDLSDRLNLTDGDEEAIASAIRSAEDDALERATNVLDDVIAAMLPNKTPTSDVMCRIYAAEAAKIRSLKSTGGGDGR